MKKKSSKELLKNAVQHEVEYALFSSLFRSKGLIIMVTIYALLILGFIYLVLP